MQLTDVQQTQYMYVWLWTNWEIVSISVRRGTVTKKKNYVKTVFPICHPAACIISLTTFNAALEYSC